MNDVVIVWLFYPFYQEKAREVWVAHYYENLNNAWEKSVEWYVAYLQDLSDHYHDNIPVNQNSFTQLLVEIMKSYLQTEDKSEKQNYLQIIHEKLYSE